ncbi:hypothetical protein BH24ACI3_BH24ACI3_02240 [soil metagenome]
MKIAKIVGSNSHIDYVARVIDDRDGESPPDSQDYGFAQFVAIDAGELTAIGVIHDSRLINPDYANFGPRLSPKPMIGKFSPDSISEQGILLGIMLLGTVSEIGECMHSVPRIVVPAASDVRKMTPVEVLDFHGSKLGPIRLNYYPHLMRHTGAFAAPLLDSIIEQLLQGCDAADRERLAVIRNSLKWQSTFGGN